MSRSAARLFVIAVTLAIMGTIGWMAKEYGAGFMGGLAAGILFREVTFRLSHGYWFTG